VVILGAPLGTLWELEGTSLGIYENTLRTWQGHKFKKKYAYTLITPKGK
jgi:hypothetical protein